MQIRRKGSHFFLKNNNLRGKTTAKTTFLTTVDALCFLNSVGYRCPVGAGHDVEGGLTSRVGVMGHQGWMGVLGGWV